MEIARNEEVLRQLLTYSPEGKELDSALNDLPQLDVLNGLSDKDKLFHISGAVSVLAGHIARTVTGDVTFVDKYSELYRGDTG